MVDFKTAAARALRTGRFSAPARARSSALATSPEGGGWDLLEPSVGWASSPLDPLRVRVVRGSAFCRGRAIPTPPDRRPVDGEEIARLPVRPVLRIPPWRIDQGGQCHAGYSVETDGRVLFAERPPGLRSYDAEQDE